MAVRYGSRWLLMWEGVDIAAVKADWVNGLALVVERSPHAITYALDNLPDDPPNLSQFRKLCNSRPLDAVPALPAPPADPARVTMALEKLTKPAERAGSQAAICAARLRAKVADGAALTLAQRAMLESCEQQASPETNGDTAFRLIPEAALPPGMRATEGAA